MGNDKHISNILHQKRKEGRTSGMWIYVGIPKMVRMGKSDDLYNWEKKWFNSRIDKRWDKNGNLIKQNDH
jgi:hypothetical protein